MNLLTRFSMKNVSAIFIIMIMLFVGGLYSATQLKEENMPNVSFPVVAVTTTYTGAPKDVMDNITVPIEKKLANIEDLDSMQSTSSDNFSMVIVFFKQNVDVDKKKQAVQDLLSELQLPMSASPPKASTFGAASFPSNYLVASVKDGIDQSELDRVFQEKIKPELEGIKGIDHMDVIGDRTSSLDIELDAAAMTSYGLSPGQVSMVINAAATTSPIGAVEIDGNPRMTRVTGNLDSLNDLEKLEIPTLKGVITLDQISKVKNITESNFNGRLDGKSAIGMILYKAGSANAVEFSEEIESKIADWKTSLPNITFKNTYDSADQIKESITGLVREGIVGAVLASLMILIFLRNVRMTLIVLVSIPLSILITLLLMMQLDLTLNTMTLGGIFIAVGRVVDDSIVVIENIYASLEKAQERKESVIALATKQVSMAITSSTLATVGVFAPLALVTGIVGEFFRPFALTIACALVSSLIVALTVIPMLSKLLVLRSKSVKAHDDSKPTKLTSFYERVLSWSLKNRIKTLLLALVLLVGTIAGTMPFLSVSFLPSTQASSTMYFQLKLPNNTPFETTDKKTQEIETYLLAKKDAQGEPVYQFVEALVGYAGSDDNRVPNASQIFVQLNEDADPDAVKAETNAYILSQLPAGSEAEPKSMEGDFGASSTDFAYTLQGDDQGELEKAAGMVIEKLKTYPELEEIEDNLSDAKSELEIVVDQKKARAYGLSAANVRDTAAGWISKQNLGRMKFDNVAYTTTLSLNQADKNSVEKLGNIPLMGSTGTPVALKDVATIHETQGAVSLTRENQAQLVKVSAKINASDKTAVSTKVSDALKELDLPAGVTPQVSGVSEDVTESFTQLFVAMAAAIFVVYLIMVLAFGNASAPFAILFSLPLAVIGGLLGLVITKEPLTVTSMIGFLMLIGIVVTNAIVLIDRAQQLREEGYTVRHALIEAGKIRLRPIIMTAGATIMALVPLALGISGEGGLIGRGLGVVVIGGLITSTILTLVVVPIVYELIDSAKNRLGRMFKRNKRNEVQQVNI